MNKEAAGNKLKARTTMVSAAESTEMRSKIGFCGWAEGVDQPLHKPASRPEVGRLNALAEAGGVGRPYTECHNAGKSNDHAELECENHSTTTK